MVSIVQQRHSESLNHALGPVIAEALARPDVVEIMANPDGSLWVDVIAKGRQRLGQIAASAAETVIRLLASHMNETVNPDYPALAGVLPQSGERFQGLLPPLVDKPTFSIRKRPTVIFTLDDYVTSGVLSAQGAQTIRSAVAQRKNILVAGGTGSGKTTLVNAILHEPEFQLQRVVLIEDTRELQCSAPDRVELLTKNTEPKVTMNDLLRMTLRLRPDRIVIGEVRGGEALAMLKAWNTGHPGGVATIHANSAQDALHRLEDLIGEVSQTIPHRSIASAINLVVFIERIASAPGRTVSQIYNATGFHKNGYIFRQATGKDGM